MLRYDPLLAVPPVLVRHRFPSDGAEIIRVMLNRVWRGYSLGIQPYSPLAEASIAANIRPRGGAAEHYGRQGFHAG